MAITILTIGKTKQDFVISGFDDFSKRLKRYTIIKTVDLPDCSIKNKSEDIVKTTEAQLILNYIKPSDFIVALDSRGKSLTSPQFADFMEIKQQQNLIFVIGGVYGLSDNVINRADYVLSFSAFTFTHQMIRLLLIEQIYRALNILHGGKYHK